MTIKMNLHKFPTAIKESSTSLNDNYNFMNSITLKNVINELEDHDVEFTKDGGLFAEAYVDSTGRLDSVDTVNTNAIYSDDNYVLGSDSTDFMQSGTNNLVNPTTISNPDNCFDTDDATYADASSTNGQTWAIGRIIPSTYVYSVKYKGYANSLSGSETTAASIQIYDGSTWTTVVTFNGTHTESYSGVYILNDTVQGVRLSLTVNGSADADVKFYTLEIYDMASESIIVHNIPSGTFSSTLQTAFLTAKVSDWETGANIQYKLTNDTEDTGYNDYNEILVASSAFTSEPTKLWVKIIPKTTNPTSGVPSIKGIACTGDRP